jgi:uncharacterized membrane protein YhhN
MKFNSYIYVLISIATSSFYFGLPNVYTKVIPILSLCVLTLCEGHKYGYLVASGLIFSSFGDIALEMEGNTFIYFVVGVCNFLIAHVFYISAYWSTNIKSSYWLLTGLIFSAYYACLMSLIIPHVDDILIAAILIYGLVICTMVFLASNRYFTTSISNSSRACAIIGSLVFAVSDSVLALNKFRGHIDNANVYIMLTYYIGQTFIALSVKDPYPNEPDNDANITLLTEDEFKNPALK